MRNHINTSRAAIAAQLSKHAITVGKDPDSFLSDAKIDPQRVYADVDARIDHRKIISLYEALNSNPDNALLGFLIGQQTQPGDLGVVGYLMKSSANLWQAFLHLDRFLDVLTEHVTFSLSANYQDVYFKIENSLDIMNLHFTWQFFASSFLAVISNVTNYQVMPRWMTFPKNSFLTSKELTGHYGIEVYRVNYGITFCFDRKEILKPLPNADAYLENLLIKEAKSQLDLLNRSAGMAHLVKKNLARELAGGQLMINGIAGCLDMSERSLQRHLAEEGTSFSKVLEQFRSENSEELLKNPSLSISQIANHLGYQNASSFNRAFVRWKGTSPRKFREKLLV